MLTEKAAMYSTLGISKEVFAFGTKIEEELKERFAKIDEIAEYNQLKVIHAMQASKVSEACLYGTTGYGYNDLGRDTLEQVYATCFGTEDALVRPQIACGTHALATALSGNLRPGDELLSPVGKPYDTLEEVIGIRPSVGSLAEYGVTYRQVDLKEDSRDGKADAEIVILFLVQQQEARPPFHRNFSLQMCAAQSVSRRRGSSRWFSRSPSRFTSTTQKATSTTIACTTG